MKEKIEETKKIIEEIKKELRPKKKEKEPEEFIKKINEEIKKEGIKAEAMIGGSYAKNTYLPGDHDIDCFVRFEKKYTDKEIPELVEKILKKISKKVKRIHGSRDYFQIKKGKYLYELVPVTKITRPEEARNITDISPLHVKYVKEEIKKKPGLEDEIRLMKKFCKSAKTYGAESYINGFSGHTIDLIIINYGGFLEAIKNISKWKPGTIINPANKKIRKEELNPAKTQGPLIIIDPIQPNRNAAAALKKEAFNKLIKRAKEFLEKPTKEYFKEEKLTKEKILKENKEGTTTIYELTATDENSKDIRGTKLLKAHQQLIRKAKEEGFTIIKEGFEFDGKKALCYINVKEKELPREKEHQGPPITDKEACEKFRKKHKKTYEKKGRLYTKIKRKHRTIKELIKEEIKTEYIKQRTKKTRIIS